MFGMFQSPILGAMDKSSAPTGWNSTPLRSDCTTLLTQKGEVDQGTTQCTLGASYTTYQADGAITLLPGLRLRSYSAYERNVGIPDSRTLRQRHLRKQQTS
jgi:hypothetical protein